MKNLIFLFVFIVLALKINAQITPPAIQWQKSLGSSSDEFCYSIQQTNDGGYIVAGSCGQNGGDVTGWHGGYDYWVVKLDSLGNLKWQKCLGGSNIEYAYSISQTNDGGFIVAGESASNDGDVTGNHGYSDYWVVKLDTGGNIQWQKSLGGSKDEEAYSVIQTSDGGYIVAGGTYSNDGDVSGNHDSTGSYADYWIVKLDTGGNKQWQKSLGGTLYDKAYSIIQTKDGGYIVAGGAYSNDGDVLNHHGSFINDDYWLVKLDTVGNIQWQKCLGGSSNDCASSIRQTKDGGYIVAGSADSNDGDVTGNHGNNDYWVVKLDSSGNIQWQKSLGGTSDDYAYSIWQTNDGGYIVAGESASINGDVTGHHGTPANWDYWVVKLDTSGNIQWQKSLGGSQDDEARSIQQTSDGGYVVAGESESSDGDVTVNHGYFDFWVVKLGFTTGIKENLNNSHFSVFPNPSTGNFTAIVTQSTKYIQIFNSLGQILEKRVVNNESNLNFEIKENGIYFIQIVSDNQSVIKKVIITRE